MSLRIEMAGELVVIEDGEPVSTGPALLIVGTREEIAAVARACAGSTVTVAPQGQEPTRDS